MKCPYCTHPFAVVWPLVDPKRTPRAGSCVICETCLEMAVYTAEGTLRMATRDELPIYVHHLRRLIHIARGTATAKTFPELNERKPHQGGSHE